MTPSKFRQLFGELSPTQLNIINDKESKYIVVAAGPGSGKTRILVHKLASLLLMEDVKHEQLLMLTFSRAAATEFKKRLLKLVGAVADQLESLKLGVVDDSVRIYPVTPILSDAVNVVIGIVNEVAVAGIVKAVTVGAVVSGKVITTESLSEVETLPAASFAQA